MRGQVERANDNLERERLAVREKEVEIENARHQIEEQRRALQELEESRGVQQEILAAKEEQLVC